MNVSGEQIVAEARGWLGTPYQHQAALRGVGCDCIGLIAGVADALGLPEAKAWRRDSRFSGYGETPRPDLLLAACDAYLDRIGEPQLGDVVLFAFMRDPMHFGLLSHESPSYIIHAYGPIGRVVENGLAGKWPRRVVGAFRYRGKA